MPRDDEGETPHSENVWRAGAYSLLFLSVAYVLSAAPVLRFWIGPDLPEEYYGRVPVRPHLWETIYAPVIRITRSPAFGAPVLLWSQLWGVRAWFREFCDLPTEWR